MATVDTRPHGPGDTPDGSAPDGSDPDDYSPGLAALALLLTLVVLSGLVVAVWGIRGL